MRARRTPSSAAPLLALLVTGCAAPGPPPRCSYPSIAPPPRAAARISRYEVQAGPGAEELCVVVDLAEGTDRLGATPAILPFLRDVRVSRGGERFVPVTASAGGFDLPGCERAPCRARYRVLLGDAARTLHDRDTAIAHRGAFFAPSSTWLLAPTRPGPEDRFRLHVTTLGGGYVNGLFAAPGAEGEQEGQIVDLSGAPYAAFGLASSKRVEMPGGDLAIALSAGSPDLGRARIEGWIEAQARAVASYYGRFPAPHAAILVVFTERRGIGGGSTMGSGGASVQLSVGERSSADDLAGDWILVHELVHVAFPNVGVHWVEEGLATYVEPLIRVRAGLLDPDELFRDLITGLPQGQPEVGDRGLDHTDTWGRRYWGGALFWFLADIAIRQRTGNARSLDDALRRIVAEGGNVGVTWTVERALSEGDRDSGGAVLQGLWKRLGGAPVTTDLEAIWRDLGVHLDHGAVVYDDAAPLASIRRGIAARR